MLLFCCGEYADIVVVHPLTLEVVYWLSSKVNSNWVTSLHIFRPRAVTGTGRGCDFAKTRPVIHNRTRLNGTNWASLRLYRQI